MILSTALLCLSQNIFYESRSEPVLGQYAVAQVTMHRAQGKKAKVCQVVHAKHQFSWTAHRQPDPVKIDPDAYVKAQKIAAVVLRQKLFIDFSHGANYYHAVYVHPKWAKHFVRTAQIGRHIFYKG